MAKIAINSTERFSITAINHISGNFSFEGSLSLSRDVAAPGGAVPSVLSPVASAAVGSGEVPGWPTLRKTRGGTSPQVSPARERHQAPGGSGFSGPERSEGRRTTQAPQAPEPEYHGEVAAEAEHSSRGGGFGGSRGFHHFSETVFSALIAQTVRNTFLIYF